MYSTADSTACPDTDGTEVYDFRDHFAYPVTDVAYGYYESYEVPICCYDFENFVNSFNLPMRLWHVIAGKMKGFYQVDLNRRLMPDGKCLIKRKRKV